MLRIGVDRGDRSVEQLEHDLLAALSTVDLAPPYVATHQIRDGDPHWAAAVELPGSPLASLDLIRALAAALAEPAHDDGTHRLAFADPHAPGTPGPGPAALAAVGEPGEDEIALGAEAGRPGARQAAVELRDRSAGRLVRFPGQDALPAELTWARLRATTPIRELLAVGTAITDDTVVLPSGHVRPSLVDGSVALAVVPAGPGRVRPFELPVPRQCCETPDQYAARLSVYEHVHRPTPVRA